MSTVKGASQKKIVSGAKKLAVRPALLDGRLAGVVGVDEVGRGCWAGPLVVGAVALDQEIAGLTDSKLLTAGNRSELAAIIYEKAVYANLGWVEPIEIDQLGLTAATTLAAQRALADLQGEFKIIIDGKFNFLPEYPKVTTIIKADQIVPAVSAASIIAKVARDDYMARQAEKYTGYGFENHVGYGTKRHVTALKQFGICPLHRQSFSPIKLIISQSALA